MQSQAGKIALDKQLIVVSRAGQRLQIQLKDAVLTTLAAPSDDFTYVVFEEVAQAKAGGARRKNKAAADVEEGKGPYPEPKPDIQASLVGGLPTGVEVLELSSFKKFYGSITLADLAEEFESTIPGNPTLFVLEPKNGG